jgi:3-deoxy-D-arabino-heptulosonate 7-phosphate (DAHP) synthase class II
MTRIDSRTGNPYITSGHFIWVGERTRQIDNAHIDFLSRVRNPIGVKLGPTTQVSDVIELIEKLNLAQDADTDTIENLIAEVLSRFPEKVQEYKNGKTGLLGLFVGEVMKASKGKADPRKTNEQVRKMLDA